MLLVKLTSDYLNLISLYEPIRNLASIAVGSRFDTLFRNRRRLQSIDQEENNNLELPLLDITLAKKRGRSQ